MMDIKASLTGGCMYTDNSISEIRVIIKDKGIEYGAGCCFNENYSETSCLVLKFKDITDFMLFIANLQKLLESFDDYITMKNNGIEINVLEGNED